MKIVLKNIYIFLATVSFLLIITDCGLFRVAFLPNQPISDVEYADLAIHTEDSHSNSFEDEVFTNDIFNNHFSFTSSSKFIPLLDFSIHNNFSFSVWQPPKKS